jgi:hypothetical protein
MDEGGREMLGQQRREWKVEGQEVEMHGTGERGWRNGEDAMEMGTGG